MPVIYFNLLYPLFFGYQVKYLFIYLFIFFTDPFEDQFTKKREAKKGRIAKNEARHRRNVDEAEAALNPSKGVDARSLRRIELQKQVAMSKTATASIGKFDKP